MKKNIVLFKEYIGISFLLISQLTVFSAIPEGGDGNPPEAQPIHPNSPNLKVNSHVFM